MTERDALRDLRLRAKQKVHGPRNVGEISPDEARALVYDLEVHQTELELQNEELRGVMLELEGTRDRFRDLYEFAPVGHVTLDAEGRILEANLETASLLGCERAALPGRRLQDFVARESQDALHLHQQALLAERKPHSCEVTLRPRESVSRSLRIKGTALPGPERKSQLALVDISDRVAAEAALREAKDTLERTVAARTTELEQVHQLRQEAALAGERERRELSILLHDSVGQLLPLANTKVALAKRSSDEATRAKLEEIERLIHEAHSTATSLTRRLNPPVIHEIGLEAGLHALSRELRRDWDLRVSVEDGGSDAMLSDAVRFAVYRVVRELLLNVAKHAGSDAARVVLRGSGSFLDVIVEDEGHGFVPDRLRGPGLGLETADEQLRYLGGRMEIRSEPGQGTRVALRVPCIAPEADPDGVES